MGTPFHRSALNFLLGLLSALVLAQIPAQAGCAIAIQILPNGSYSTRSTNSTDPKFGHRYQTVDQAVAFLKEELKKHEMEDAPIVFKSDQTGYFSFAVGHAPDGTLVNNVGIAKHPRDADKQAMDALQARGVTDGQVAQRFFSYGEPSAGGPGGSPGGASH